MATNGLGAELVKYWDTYDKVLNLILGGDASSVGQEVTGYVAMEDRDEQYKDLLPNFKDECPSVSEEYQYLFDDGKWYVRGDYEIKDWVLVSEYLEKNSRD